MITSSWIMVNGTFIGLSLQILWLCDNMIIKYHHSSYIASLSGIRVWSRFLQKQCTLVSEVNQKIYELHFNVQWLTFLHPQLHASYLDKAMATMMRFINQQSFLYFPASSRLSLVANQKSLKYSRTFKYFTGLLRAIHVIIIVLCIGMLYMHIFPNQRHCNKNDATIVC